MIAGLIQRTLGNPKLLSDENKQDTIARLRDWQAVTGQQTFLASDNFIPEGAFKMKLVKLSAMRNERSKKLFSLISALPSTAILRGGLAAILYALVFTGFVPQRTTHSQKTIPDYKNARLPIDTRVADLLSD